MHPCPENWVAIGHAVAYFAQAAHAFSAGIKCRHCSPSLANTLFYFTAYTATLNAGLIFQEEPP